MQPILKAFFGYKIVGIIVKVLIHNTVIFMDVISTNIGTKKKIIYRGKEILTGIYKYPVNEPLHLGKTDVENDAVIDRRYHGGADKACYIYSADHYPFWQQKYPNLDWSWGMFGENLSVKGMDESELYIGDIFKVGTSVVQITQPRQPCFKLGIRLEDDKAVKEFVKANKPGAYVRILVEGKIKVGDRFIPIEQKPDNLSIKEIYHLIYNEKDNIEQIKKAVQMPELAESCRKDLNKMAGFDIT